jgi:hypothetical protein
MPWSEVTSSHQRVQFIADVLRATDDFTVVCERYHVSRKTGYKWLARYEAGGAGGLVCEIGALDGVMATKNRLEFNLQTTLEIAVEFTEEFDPRRVKRD